MASKRHSQLEFKGVNQHGGFRKGAGRKKGKRVSHAQREEVDFKTPLHITKRLKRGLGGLRTQRLLGEFQGCLRMAREKGMHTLHFSIQNNHVHMKVEAKNNDALAKGMNCLWARFGRIIRKKIGGAGAVFEERYHLHILKSPREVRNALAYILLNQSKHNGMDYEYGDFSSARFFKNFGFLVGKRRFLADDRSDPLPDYLSEPRSWLAREGWRKAPA